MTQLDIWGNITHYEDDETWYKQSFMIQNLVRYEDYQGNIWDPSFGKIPFPILELNSAWKKYHKDITFINVDSAPRYDEKTHRLKLNANASSKDLDGIFKEHAHSRLDTIRRVMNYDDTA